MYGNFCDLGEKEITKNVCLTLRVLEMGQRRDGLAPCGARGPMEPWNKNEGSSRNTGKGRGVELTGFQLVDPEWWQLGKRRQARSFDRGSDARALSGGGGSHLRGCGIRV